MSKTILGKVSVTPKKAYNNATTYKRLDIVTYDGCSYMCLKTCTGVTPVEGEYWQLLADKGHFTAKDKEEFKKAVVADSKTEINEYADTKKTELDNYTIEQEKSLKTELDTYTNTKKTELYTKETELETKMSNKKDELVKKIEDAQSGFDTHVATKTKEFDDNVTKKTTDFDTNAQDKTNEYNDNHTAKLEEYNNNSKAKIEEFNDNAQSYATELDELANQMPWNTTEIAESLHIEDSAKYSRNKLDLFGNLKQETRSGKNLCDNSKYNDGVYYSFNNETITLLKKDARTSSQINDNEKITLPGGTYTITIYSVTYPHSIQFIVFNGDTIRNINGNSGTFTLTQETTFFIKPLVGLQSEVTLPIKFNIQIELGSASTEYEQFGAMPSIEYPSMPIVATGLQKIKKIGKNFIPYPYAENSKSTYGIQYTVNKDGSIAVSGTSKNPACDFYLYGSSTDTGEYLYVKKGTYSIADTNIYNILYIAREKTLGALVGVAKIKQALASQDCYFYGYFLRVEKDITVNATFYPQLELNDTETFYEPYSGEEMTLDLGTTELCKITDQDGNVVAQDGAVYRQVNNILKWQWKKNVYKDSITNLNDKRPLEMASYLADNLFGVVFNSSKKHKILGQVTAIMSDKLKAKLLGSATDTTNTDSVRNVEGIALHSNNNNQICITLEKTRLESEDLEGVRNFINENNIICYYPILEPIYLDCTEEQSAVLDKLYKLSLEKGTNNIFVESENGVTTELQLEYMQNNNLKKEQENKALEDRITAIENLLSTTETSALLLDNMQNDLESEVE
jgi:hypothetical protein